MSSHFARQSLEKAAARMLEGLLCNSAARPALVAIGELVARFVEETGRRASLHRDLASRSSGNLSDILHALEELGVSPASLLAPLTPKITPTDKLPKFPVFVPVELPPSLVDEEDNGALPEEAPSWLPPLPPKHSYVQTPSVATKKRQDDLAHEERKSLVEGYLERASKRARPDDEAKEEGVVPLVAPASIDQAWADAHATRRVRGTRVAVEQGPRDEDENEYQLRLKAEKIVSRRDHGE